MDAGPDPHESLERLRLAVLDLAASCKQVKAPCDLPQLKAVIATLDVPRILRAPVGIEEQARRWRRYLDHQVESLDPRTIQHLCWHPQIATGSTFQHYLDHNRIAPGSRALVGLVHSCHAVWTPDFSKTGIIKKVRQRLRDYNGPNRLLAKWRQSDEMIIGDRGPESAGSEMLRDAQPVEAFCKKWGIHEDSAYVQAAVAQAAQLCTMEMDRVPALRRCLLAQLLPWPHWEPRRFKEQASSAILSPAANSADVRDSLRDFVATEPRLGDPRFERNRANWALIRDAERKAIEWFSQFDIEFFFDHVLPRGADPHGRKEFWLRYKTQVGRSRTLLNWSDRTRLYQHLRSKGLQSAPFGNMANSKSTSCFVLVLVNHRGEEKIVAVEFSAVGNACYLYSVQDFKMIMPEFWTSRAFAATELKSTELSLTKKRGALWDGWHKVDKRHKPSWKGDASQLLAAYGIRP